MWVTATPTLISILSMKINLMSSNLLDCLFRGLTLSHIEKVFYVSQVVGLAVSVASGEMLATYTGFLLKILPMCF